MDGPILFKGRVYIEAPSNLRQTILELVHDAGHEGVHKTLHKLRAGFHFPNDRRVVQDSVRSCAVCQRNKTKHLQPDGLLQPLGVPSAVDLLSKAAHFIPLGHPYTTTSVARTFFAEAVRLHGIPHPL